MTTKKPAQTSAKKAPAAKSEKSAGALKSAAGVAAKQGSATASTASDVKVRSAKPAKKERMPKQEVPEASKTKPAKIKLVRDSFTMPEAEYAVLGEVKKECLKAGMAVKKSELLRIGVSLVRKLDVKSIKEMVDALPVLKAGRPKKSK